MWQEVDTEGPVNKLEGLALEVQIVKQRVKYKKRTEEHRTYLASQRNFDIFRFNWT